MVVPSFAASFAASFTVVACSSASATSMEEARKALTTNSNPRCSNNSRAFPGAATETAANVCMANIGTGGKKRGGKKNVMVCDLTACVGGNVLSFGKQFDYVYGIEIDPTRHRMLQNNVRVMHDYRTSATSGRSGRNFQRSQIHTVCGDAVLLLQPTPPGNILVQDFLSQWSPSSVGVRIDEMIYFLDPPWGGLNYKNQSSISLTLGATPIATVVALCLKVW